MSRAVGIVPARLASTRLPGKVLRELGGKPMLQWVYERASAATHLSAVYVATDSDEISRACEAFDAQVVRTRSEHESGTDRVAEAAARLAEHGLLVDREVVVNVQADEPFIDPEVIDSIVTAFEDSDVDMVSAMTSVRDLGALHDSSVVKVVVDRRGDALYFTRAPIGFTRSDLDARVGAVGEHIGIYGFRCPMLAEFAALDPAELELIEGLEQLRALEHGRRIRMVRVQYCGFGIDTPDDLDRARAMIGRTHVT